MPTSISPAASQIFKSIFPSDLSGLKYKSLGHAICERLECHSNKVLFVDNKTGVEWTGEDIKKATLGIAACLIDEFNFKQGTYACVFYDHSITATIAALGVVCAGGIVTEQDKFMTFAELLTIVERLNVKLFFGYHDKLNYVTRFEEESNVGVKIDHTISMDGPVDSSKSFNHIEQLMKYERQMLSNTLKNLPVPCLDVDNKKDFAIILFSSGTTGMPKAVPRTHANCLMIFCDSSLLSSSQAGAQVVACSSPLQYISGLVVALNGIHVGNKLVIINSAGPADILKAIERYKMTRIYLGVGSTYEFMTYPKLENFDISSLQAMSFGGARLSYVEIAREFFAKYKHVSQVRCCYGCSETSVATYRAATPEKFLDDPGNCGIILPDCEFKIVDTETREPLSANKVGLIFIRGQHLFPGYLSSNNNQQLVIDDKDVFDDQGFYNTGDIGYISEKGELYCEGRFKETMNCRNSLKVLPYELETTLTKHPCVASAVVFGIPCEVKPSLVRPRAFVVLKRNVYELKLGEKFPSYCDGDYSKFDDKEAFEELQGLERRGTHTLCSLDKKLRHAIEFDIVSFFREQLSREKQLIGGLIILDEIPTLKVSEKVDKRRLQALTDKEVEIFGEMAF